MSKVEIEIPDDRWFRGEWRVRPQDKQLCVVIEKESLFNTCIGIAQYRKGNDNFRYVLSHMIEKYGIGYINMNAVDRWKPLGLPEDVNERGVAEIEKWFEEDAL